jgi:RND family efflux transporter MFP subunit
MDSQVNTPQTEHAASATTDLLPESAPLRSRTVRRVLVFALLLAVLIIIVGMYNRHREKALLAQNVYHDAVPVVVAGQPALGAPVDTFALPGNVTAWSDAPVYARTSGYLVKWHYDIGSRVKKGALLAQIASPEVDQQVAQAEADLATAQATARNASMQAERYKGLVTADAVTRQDTDTYTNLAASTSSAVLSSRANLARLKQLQSFEKIYAPFDGVVTARNIETGQLVTEGSASELFHVQALGKLRVYTNVPEIYSAGIHLGEKVNLGFVEYPGKYVEGTIVRTSQVIDPANRTLLVEIDIDNSKGEWKPGSLAQVYFKEKVAMQTYILPVSALIFRNENVQVATVVNGNAVHLKQVIIGKDNGATVQIIAGLTANDLVIQDPPDYLIENARIRVSSIVKPHAQMDGAEKQGSPSMPVNDRASLKGEAKPSGKGGK